MQGGDERAENKVRGIEEIAMSKQHITLSYNFIYAVFNQIHSGAAGSFTFLEVILCLDLIFSKKFPLPKPEIYNGITWKQHNTDYNQTK